MFQIVLNAQPAKETVTGFVVSPMESYMKQVLTVSADELASIGVAGLKTKFDEFRNAVVEKKDTFSDRTFDDLNEILISLFIFKRKGRFPKGMKDLDMKEFVK